MTDDRYLGITFPFQEDLKGKYLKLNKIDKDEIRSQLSNLITTMRGERLYKPDFGTNVMQYLFEPLDDSTYNDIRQEILGAVTKYINQVQIQNVEATINESQLFIGLRISYTISTGVFQELDELNLLF